MANWKEFYKADLYTADKVGKTPLTKVIEAVGPETMTNKEKGDEVRLHVKFVDDDVELRLNVGNVRNLGKAFGEDTDDWVGKKVRLSVCDTSMNGKAVKGVRIEGIKK